MKEGIQENIPILFEKWKKSLTEEEKKILKEYTKYLYEDLNNSLRENFLSDSSDPSPDDTYLKEIIQKIDEILNRFLLTQEILVYRNEHHNISLEDLYYSILGIKSINYQNYISTSISEEASKNFFSLLKNKYPKENFLILKGNIEKGIACGYLDKDLSFFEDEKEILIARNINFYIEHDKTTIDKTNNSISINGTFRKE